MKARSRSRVLAGLGAALALAALGCSDSSTGESGGQDAMSDSTTSTPEDSSASASPDGEGMEASPGPLDATTADDGLAPVPTDASLDALSETGTAANEPEAGDAAGPGIRDASEEADTGPDGGAPIDAGSDASAPGPEASAPPFDAGTPTFTSIYANIITPNCAECHAQSGPLESNLYMGTQQDAYNNLVNVHAMGDACGVPGIDGGPPPIRVIPGDAADSLLYQKITDTQHCGSAMPQDADPLTIDQILTIKAWINQGAQDN
jgi:hypothetical protein